MPVTFNVKVKTTTALHIGTQQQLTDVSDSPFRRTAKGDLVIPGTSIAGAMRGHLTRILPLLSGLGENICVAMSDNMRLATDRGFANILPQGDVIIACGCALCHLMGDVSPQNHLLTSLPDDDPRREKINGRASRLIVYDVIIPKTDTKVRDGVGIDRLSGTAARAARSKFDAETLPAGTEFTIRFELDDSADENDEALLDLALAEWQAGRIYLGANTSRGLGAVEVVEISNFGSHIRYDSDALMRFLRSEDQTQSEYIPKSSIQKYLTGYASQDGMLHSFVKIQFLLTIDGFFLVNDITQAEAEGFNHYSYEFLPGSSLRGTLRNHAEKIARTIANQLVDRNSADPELDYVVTNPAADALNNIAQRGEANDEYLTDAERLLLQHLESGVSRWLDIYQEEQPDSPQIFDLADQLFGNTYFGSRLKVHDAYLPDNAKAVAKPLDFVAIDRFTGGAADKFKFDAHALWNPTFDVTLYLENPEQWELGWLLYVLQDIKDGLLNFGFGSAKGFGQGAFDMINFDFGWAYNDFFPHESPPQAREDGLFLRQQVTGDSVQTALDASWVEAWTSAWRDAAQNFQMSEKLTEDGHVGGIDYYWSNQFYNPPIHELYKRQGE